MLQFNIDEIEKRTLSGLKDFQRATVERVDYLFRHNQNRVLVADEVGMGKNGNTQAYIMTRVSAARKRKTALTYLECYQTVKLGELT